MKKKMMLSLVIVLMLVVAAASVVWAKDKPAAAPGVQKNNSGCVGCHQGSVTLPDGTQIDISLAGEVNGRIPTHVKLEAGTTINECMKCHQKEGVMDKFKNTIHNVHWNSQLFGIEFNAPNVTDRCNFCHDMSYLRGFNDSAKVY